MSSIVDSWWAPRRARSNPSGRLYKRRIKIGNADRVYEDATSGDPNALRGAAYDLADRGYFDKNDPDRERELNLHSVRIDREFDKLLGDVTFVTIESHSPIVHVQQYSTTSKKYSGPGR